MCEFCENIIESVKDLNEALIKGGDFIYRDDERIGIFIDTGDSGCPGSLDDVKYCPMCGRKLV